jgi:glucose/arabinose dehydrogenase
MMRFSFIFVGLIFPLFAGAITEKVVVKGMDRPWAIVAAPDGNLWVSQKFAGDILIFNSKFEKVGRLTGFTGFKGFVEGGMLDIAFHPKFSEKPWVYVVYVVGTKELYKTRLARFTYKNGKLQDLKTLFHGPESEIGHHFGSRLLFDDTGHLLASFGERYDKEKAQDLKEMHGKIVRLTDEGEPAADNPFPLGVHSYGHRNPQGLAMHPLTRKIYDSDHGPSNFDAPGGGDEINLIEMGKNYGWPKIHHKEQAKDMVSPLLEYTPSVAPSGIAFYTGALLPKWKNDLFVACLAGRKLLRIRFDSKGKVTETESLLSDKYGRLRDVETGVDGSLLVLAEDGRIIQVTE